MGPERQKSNEADPPTDGRKPAGPPSSKDGPHDRGLETSAPMSALPAARRDLASPDAHQDTRHQDTRRQEIRKSSESAAALRGPRPAARRRAGSGQPDRALQDLWVERLRAGDPEALRDVVGAFGERLTAVVSGVLRDRDAVQDVVQETFTKAFYRIHSFKGGSSLYTWLYRVAVNAAKDYIKSRKRRPAASFDDLPGRAALPSHDRPVVEGLERRELRLRVRAAIDRLPRRFRTVLALREIEGMTYNEIAEVLALSLGTVESRLFRARRRLRNLLATDPHADLHADGLGLPPKQPSPRPPNKGGAS